MCCPVSLTIMTLKKLVYLKYELSLEDHVVEFFYQNHFLDDHLTIMDVVYMFDWKRVNIIVNLLIYYISLLNNVCLIFRKIHFQFHIEFLKLKLNLF